MEYSITTDFEKILNYFLSRGPREIRILFHEISPLAGVFDDPTYALKTITQLNESPHVKGIFISLNVVKNELICNSFSRKYYISGDDISVRDHLFIDIDSKESVDIKPIAINIIDWLMEEGWPNPLFACSGNGYHLLYPMNDTVTDKFNEFYVSEATSVISNRFGSSVIDTKVSNASRHARVYGTYNRKEDKPVVQSYVMDFPENENLDISSVIKLAKTKRNVSGLYVTSVPQDTEINTYTKYYLSNGASPGNRNNSLFSAACDLARFYSKTDAIKMLTGPSLRSGLSEYEINRTIDSAYRNSRDSINFSVPQTFESVWYNLPYSKDYPKEWEIRLVPVGSKYPWDKFGGKEMVGTFLGGRVTGAVDFSDSFIGKMSVIGTQLLQSDYTTVTVVSGAKHWLELMKQGTFVLGLIPNCKESALIVGTIPGVIYA